jgi:hypothetical protein
MTLSNVEGSNWQVQNPGFELSGLQSLNFFLVQHKV